jgi:hypothetical protein
MTLIVGLGNGTKIFFWTDRWIAGQSIAELAPDIFAAMRPHAVKQRMVAPPLLGNSWIRDFSGTLSIAGINQFLHLVEIVEAQQLDQDFDMM